MNRPGVEVAYRAPCPFCQDTGVVRDGGMVQPCGCEVSKAPMPAPLYVGRYREIASHITWPGYLVFSQVMPTCRDGRRREWTQMISAEDWLLLSKRPEETDTPTKVAIAHRIIDQAHKFI